VEFAVLLQPFDGFDLFAMYLAGGNQAGIDRFAVNNDRAGAAFALAATFLGPGQEQFFPEQFKQSDRWIRFDSHFLAVYCKLYLHFFTSICLFGVWCSEFGDKPSPYEFCPLNQFCKSFEVSTVYELESFNQDELDSYQRAEEAAGSYCFQDDARHTQREQLAKSGEGNKKSRFVCCIEKNPVRDGFCKPNDCNGRFTGIVEPHGCKLYAIDTNGTFLRGCGGWTMTENG